MAVKFSPWGNQQFVTSAGVPASGYKLFSYAAGSTTKQNTYTDSTGATPQTNPIILDSNGFPTNGPIWLTVGQTYKFVLAPSGDSDPPTSPIKTIDVIAGVNDSSISTSQWQSSGVTPTYVSTTSFTLSGDQTTEFHVGRKCQFTVTAGTVYGKIATTAYTTLTTVTMTMDSGQTLDSGLSAVNLSILRADHIAVPYYDGMASQSDQETATSIVKPVTPGTQKYHPSAAKAWVLYDTRTGAAAISASYNVTSITDNGVGDITVTFTVPFSSANYSFAGSASASGAGSNLLVIGDDATFNKATGSFRCVWRAVSGTATDGYYCSLVFFGDQ